MRLLMAAGAVLAALLLAGCSEPNSQGQQTTTEESTMNAVDIPGYTGGCDPFTIYVQNQFRPYGTMVRRKLDQQGESAGLHGNDILKAFGWTKTDHLFYPENPDELQGKYWFYVKLPDGSFAWVPDAGVRIIQLGHAPTNENKWFDKSQAVPLRPECELHPR